MKRTPVLLVAAALVASGLGTDALAAAKKPAPKPVTMTWYLHGDSSNGNADLLQGDSGYLPMDAKAPTGTSAKEVMIYGLATSPNSQCTGGPLLPSWTGLASGMLQGKVNVTFFARSTPANAIVRVLNVADGGCNEAYTEPLAEAVVALPASPTAVPVTVTLPIPKPSKLMGALTLQILEGQTAGLLEGPQISGVSYDSTATPSKVTFTCLPKPGKKAC